MRRIDTDREDLIRRWPVWFARLANRFIRWSDVYCGGRCGYPISHRFRVEREKWLRTTIYVGVCSLGGECERIALTDFRDDHGRTYEQARDDIVEALSHHYGEQPPVCLLTLTR